MNCIGKLFIYEIFILLGLWVRHFIGIGFGDLKMGVDPVKFLETIKSTNVIGGENVAARTLVIFCVRLRLDFRNYNFGKMN